MSKRIEFTHPTHKTLIAGTEWPHYAEVRRQGRRWGATEITNGTSIGFAYFDTQHEAIAAIEAKGYVRD